MPAGNEKLMESTGMKMKLKLNGNMTIEIKIDKRTGWPIEVVISQTLSGSTEVEPNALLPQGMAMPMEMKGNTKITNQ